MSNFLFEQREKYSLNWISSASSQFARFWSLNQSICGVEEFTEREKKTNGNWSVYQEEKSSLCNLFNRAFPLHFKWINRAAYERR